MRVKAKQEGYWQNWDDRGCNRAEFTCCGQAGAEQPLCRAGQLGRGMMLLEEQRGTIRGVLRAGMETR